MGYETGFLGFGPDTDDLSWLDDVAAACARTASDPSLTAAQQRAIIAATQAAALDTYERRNCLGEDELSPTGLVGTDTFSQSFDAAA